MYCNKEEYRFLLFSCKGTENSVLLRSHHYFLIRFMATNPPKGDKQRKGAVRKRSQVLNPLTKRYVKRDADTGLFMDMKANDKPFKGVRKEK